MSEPRDALRSLAEANEREADQLQGVVAPQAREQARGAAVVAKAVPDAIAAEIGDSLRDGSLPAAIKREVERLGLVGVPTDPSTLDGLARIFAGFAQGRVVERWDDLGTKQVEGLLTRATAADVRATTLREQASKLRDLSNALDTRAEGDERTV